MLFFVTGANGSGKTACLPALSRLLPNFHIHDFAEVGVPAYVDATWRQQTTQYWINTYIAQYQPTGQHAVISGEAVFGEIYACPAVEQVDTWHACLLDCDDITRVDRLRQRAAFDPGMDILCWAAWMRVHAVDPGWCPEVIITANSHAGMQWERWTTCRRGDTIWHQPIINTTHLTIEETASAIVGWIKSCLACY